MGRTILCNECKSTFNEDILNSKANSDVCPVCGASLNDDSSCDVQSENLSFGDEFELSENDSFDEDKIDFWWYSISGDIEDGYTAVTCAKCGTHSGAPYPIAKCKDYMLMDTRFNNKCSKCGNELKNHILSKRPADYVDPRQREMFITYDKVPRCPICQSSQIHKISATNKVASAITFGIFAAGHVSKTFKCDTCGAKF